MNAEVKRYSASHGARKSAVWYALRRRPAWHPSLCSLILSGALVACAVSSPEQTPFAGAPPDVRTIIIKSLRAPPTAQTSSKTYDYFIERGGIFHANTRIDHLEISDSVRPVQTSHGLGWLACIRIEERGSSFLYAVFIADNHVVDARIAVLTDTCEQGHFTSVSVPEPLPKPNTKNKDKGKRNVAK